MKKKTIEMHLLFRNARSASVALAVFSWGAIPILGQVTPNQPIEEIVSRSFLVPHLLAWVGPLPPSQQESQAVLTALQIGQATIWPEGLTALEEFIATYPDSPWVPAVRCQLAKAYRDSGRDTLALEHWEAVWLATKDIPDGSGKDVADYALAHWTRLLASLGRYETLLGLILDNRDRVLDQGPLSQMWERTREAAGKMKLFPGSSYKCGSFALYDVALVLGLKFDKDGLMAVPSPQTGFSMQTLANLSLQFGLGLVPVWRESGEAIAVPCVVHWQQNHYAAVIGRDGDLYRVADPTFGLPRLMSAATINAEASGAFMVQPGQMPPGYRTLTTAETGAIFGRGNPNFQPLPGSCGGFSLGHFHPLHRKPLFA